jgi:hypothetical protein
MMTPHCALPGNHIGSSGVTADCVIESAVAEAIPYWFGMANVPVGSVPM